MARPIQSRNVRRPFQDSEKNKNTNKTKTEENSTTNQNTKCAFVCVSFFNRRPRVGVDACCGGGGGGGGWRSSSAVAVIQRHSLGSYAAAPRLLRGVQIRAVNKNRAHDNRQTIQWLYSPSIIAQNPALKQRRSPAICNQKQHGEKKTEKKKRKKKKTDEKFK